MKRDLFRDEEGFTSVGVVLALLITLSLVFSTAQVCRLNAASSKVQNVADAAALAAQNVVAEFMIVVRVCDAAVLSLSLTSLAATGLGVVALCTPATAPASEALLSAGRSVARARDSFAEKAASGLNRLQRALPFLSAASAASTAAANGSGSADYLALAVLSPGEGEEISVGAGAAAEAFQDEVDDKAEDVAKAAEEAEEAAERASEAKLRGFERDCGANPSYCMYERAQSLAGMEGADNPLYRSVDAWSFSVALERAKAYYPRRLAAERPMGDSTEEWARSKLRERFYSFAAQEVGRGYVRESEESFEALFPHVPKNTEEMRETRLYTEEAYPVTENGAGPIMHAWEGCPEASSVVRFGSIEQMEAESYAVCPECGFSAASMGKVAAASASIDNGFEYHYEKVAEAAEDYERARAVLDPLSAEVRERAGGLLDRLGEAFGSVAGMRIDARPPGGLGVIVLAACTGSSETAWAGPFVQPAGTLGARAAVSAATLVAEPAGEGASVVSSLLDGLRGDGGAAVGALGIVLDCWSGVLEAYSEGQEALDGAVSSALDGLPLAGESGLGTWAAGALQEVVSAVGLEPANLDALKPVLVNSAHVASADDGAFAAQLLSLKRGAVEHPLESNNVFQSIVGLVEGGLSEGVDAAMDRIEVAEVRVFGDGGPAVTIEFALPEAVKSVTTDVIGRIADGLRSMCAQVTGARVWE
ncbi:molybdenum cofactor biosynthesis enzyme [Gordonibacter sp. An230]|uniref:molybdenum cofactor biosynthesis enzyme n=1 Tax=Gordonibacter sp. An230 TaxID=1965592 RepID=UPI000B37FB58|nr:molybdenum cofactor biosynthesis enzyme [Gordonibacter sp. An230]OUO92127.1 molybdenum cofactor biosynthesis enzyme [Gordonibacter sp. An230]